MKQTLWDALVAMVCGIGLAMAVWFTGRAPQAQPAPQPGPAPTPAPAKPEKPDKPKRRPFRGEDYQAKVSGPLAPDGTEVHCDLPGKLHMKNSGGNDNYDGRNPRHEPGKGSGLCVWTSIEHAAWWQNVVVLQGLQKWMEHHPGGGWPKKVDEYLAKRCKELGQPVPEYVQIEGGDLDLLKLACRAGRMPSVTYSKSPSGRYQGQRIAHMVSLLHADDHWFCVLDNNYPGADKLEWMTPDEFRKSYLSKNERGEMVGWAVILLAPPPPPPPHN